MLRHKEFCLLGRLLQQQHGTGGMVVIHVLILPSYLLIAAHHKSTEGIVSQISDLSWFDGINYQYCTGFLFLTQRSQEAHCCSRQRLRWLSQEQKEQPECSSYFMNVPNHYALNKGSN